MPGCARFLTLAAVVLAASAPGAAAAITVNTESDTVADDGHCSLREAITAANGDAASGAALGECPAGAGDDIITLPAGLYPLSIAGAIENSNASGDLDIVGNLTIDGARAATTTISAAGIDRVLEVRPGATAALDDVTIADGRAPSGANGGPGVAGGLGASGGGIFSAGTLSLTRCIVRDNAAGAGGAGGNGTGGLGGGGGSGGAILSTAVLTVSDCRFAANAAGAGGASGKNSNATGQGSTGGPAGNGGAISTSAKLSITRTTFAGNAAGAGGKGGDGQGSDGVDNVTPNGGSAFGGDGASGGVGGAINAADELTLDSATLSGNRAGDGGAGGGANGGFGARPGGLGGDANAGNGGLGGGGGAIAAAMVVATNVTLDDNTAGAGGTGGASFGGPGGDGPSGGNGGQSGDALGGGGGPGGLGGAIRTTAAVTLTHVTIAGNRAGTAGSGTRGTVFPGGASGGAPGVQGPPGTNTSGLPGTAGRGGGIAVVSGTLTLANSVVSGNLPDLCDGAVGDGGHDVHFPFDTSGCPGAEVEPRLAALGDNGGPVATRAIAPGSPLLDAVPAAGAGCAAADARGVGRPAGGACDVGAFERAGPSVATGAASAITTTGAKAEGSVTPNAATASFHVEYGTDTNYGSRTSDQDAGGGTSAVPVSAELTGLAAATTYHFRVVASTRDGTTAGADATFTTATPPMTADDKTAPVISAAALKPKRFRTGKGSSLRFTLSEAAAMTATVQRARPGRRVGKRCVKPAKANRGRKRCTRWQKAARFAFLAKAGAGKRAFPKAFAGRPLKPGRYRAVLVASDAAKNRSKPRRPGFTVLRRAKS